MENEDAVEPIRVIIAEAEDSARRMLRSALQRDDITIIAEATSEGEAVELTIFYRPDVALICDRPPRLDGLGVTRSIHKVSPSTPTVLLSSSPTDDRAMHALRLGASGFLPDDVDRAALPRILRGAAEGEAAVSRRHAMALVEFYRRGPIPGAGFRPVRSPLTDREWEVLDLLVSGARTDEIARTLVLSPETVRSHMKNVYRKLEVRSRVEAVDAARRMRDLVS
jgi:DNA-binding NarL/FixJ family response regulator